MVIRCRGIKKFQTVQMTPGLMSGIRRMYKEQDFVKKPELDEQQFEQLNQIICDSMEFNLEVTVTYYQKQQYHFVMGKIDYLNQLNRTITIVDHFNDLVEIRIDNVIDIQS